MVYAFSLVEQGRKIARSMQDAHDVKRLGVRLINNQVAVETTVEQHIETGFIWPPVADAGHLGQSFERCFKLTR